MTGEKDFLGGIAHVALFMQGSLNMGKISTFKSENNFLNISKFCSP
jgi:hypothetical protein